MEKSLSNFSVGSLKVDAIQEDHFIETIVSIVTKEYHIPTDLFHSKTRKRDVVLARQVAMAMSKLFTKASLVNIGSQIGNKDHATVLHACKTVLDFWDTEKKFRSDFIRTFSRISDHAVKYFDLMHVCSTCGCQEVERKVWMKINSGKINREAFLDEVETPDIWCPKCEAHVEIMTQHDFEMYNNLAHEERQKEEIINYLSTIDEHKLETLSAGL